MLCKAGGWVASWVNGWLGIGRGGYAQDYTRGDMSPAVELSSGASLELGVLGHSYGAPRPSVSCYTINQVKMKGGRERKKGGRGQGPVQILSPRNGPSIRPPSGLVLISACVTLPVGSAVDPQEVME